VLERDAHLVLGHLDEAGSLTLVGLAVATGLELPDASRRVSELLRHGLVSGTGDVVTNRSPVFYLTPRGCEELYRLRGTTREAVLGWSAAGVASLADYADRLALSMADDPATAR
jgi:DNA-binding MarR family transcriptional regulator